LYTLDVAFRVTLTIEDSNLKFGIDIRMTNNPKGGVIGLT